MVFKCLSQFEVQITEYLEGNQVYINFLFSIPDIIFVLSVLDYLFGFNFISSSFHSKQYKYMQFAHLFLLFVYFLLFLSLLYVVTLLQFLVNMFFLSRIFTLLYNAGSDFSSKLTIVIVILNDRRKRNMTCWYVQQRRTGRTACSLDSKRAGLGIHSFAQNHSF